MNRDLEIENALALLKQLSERLNLSFEYQDWGIINADSRRIREFIHCFEDNPEFTDAQKYDLFELVIASVNDALEEGIVWIDDWKLYKEFIWKYKDVYRSQIDYWSSLPDTGEFPIAELLRDIE